MVLHTVGKKLMYLRIVTKSRLYVECISDDMDDDLGICSEDMDDDMDTGVRS